MRIGVDVGGTNTDAVLMDGPQVLALSKSPTTPDISGGIVAAVRKVLEQGSVSPDRIVAVMIGTTHFTNAFVEGKRLLEVGTLRLSLPAGRAIPPMVDWPDNLRQAVGSHSYQVHGGYHFDGRVNSPLDEQEIVAAARDMRSKGLRSVAIAGIFSQVNAAQEERAAEIVRDELPEARVEPNRADRHARTRKRCHHQCGSRGAFGRSCPVVPELRTLAARGGTLIWSFCVIPTGAVVGWR